MAQIIYSRDKYYYRFYCCYFYCQTAPLRCAGLSGLLHLWVDGNAFSGPLAFLSSLSALTQLQADNNRFSGSLSFAAALGHLTRLALPNNSLTGPLPASLANLTELTLLDLGRNHLSGPVSAAWGGMTQLEQMSLSDNALTGGVCVLAALTELVWLDLQNNSFGGSVSCLAALAALQSLDLQVNQFEDGLAALLSAGLSVLVRMNVSRNRFADGLASLATHARDMPQLIALDASSNHLTNGPGKVYRAVTLTFLHAPRQGFSKVVFDEIIPPARAPRPPYAWLPLLGVFIAPGDARPFLLRTPGPSNAFLCPYPLLGANVLFDTSPCLHRWPRLLALFGIGLALAAFSGLLVYKLCFPLRPALRKAVWLASWLQAAVSLGLYLSLCVGMRAYTALPVGNCAVINQPQVCANWVFKMHRHNCRCSPIGYSWRTCRRYLPSLPLQSILDLGSYYYVGF
jgi:hypothetical protein